MYPVYADGPSRMMVWLLVLSHSVKPHLSDTPPI